MRFLKRYALVKGLEIPLDGSPVYGSQTASITIVEFSDFECPFCAKTAEQLKRFQAAYPDYIRLVFKHLPLTSIHPNAMLASRAAYAAHRQGKFWQMHDTLFSVQGSPLTKERIQIMAEGLGIDVDKFMEDMESPGALAAINADQERADDLGVNSTPTIFINGREVKEGLKGLQARIEEEFLRRQHISSID